MAGAAFAPPIAGFREKPEVNANGTPYEGRLHLNDVQLTLNPNETIATATVTTRQLVDWAEAGLILTDQNVRPRRETGNSTRNSFRVEAGYPDPQHYVFDVQNADDIAEKLLEGRARHLNPLVWNLRPATFDTFYDPLSRSLYMYEGRIYLPDSHHRHQANAKGRSHQEIRF